MTSDEMSEITITRWTDAVVDEHGFGPHSREFATLWTPILGPAAAAIFRTLNDVNEMAPEMPTTTVPLSTLSASIGLGARKGRTVVTKAIERLDRHRLARAAGNHVAVRRFAPPLSRAQMAGIAPDWQAAVGATATDYGAKRRSARAPRPVPSTGGPITQSVAKRPDATALPPKQAPETTSPPAPESTPKLRRAAIGLLRRGVTPPTARKQLALLGHQRDRIEAVVEWAQRQPDIVSVRAGHVDMVAPT